MSDNFKFKRNESFRIRDGWVEKALNVIEEVGCKDVFSKNNGIAYLGIGSNMVKSVKYWLGALGLIKNGPSSDLTESARLLLQYDRYLEDMFSWFFLNHKLVTNEKDAPVFYYAFNLYPSITISRHDLSDQVFEYYDELVGNTLNYSSVESDVSVFFQSYYADEKELEESPEDRTVCPFAYLKLFRKIDKKGDVLSRHEPSVRLLDPYLVYYSLYIAYEGKPFSIDDAETKIGGPCKTFNLSKTTLSHYLSELKDEGLVEVNRTAGLNMIYFKRADIDEKWLFAMHFGARK